MLRFFKSKTKEEKLIEKHDKLLEEAYRLSRTDRMASDLKYAEAEELLKEIDQLKNQN